jgi:hypothetical protein
MKTIIILAITLAATFAQAQTTATTSACIASVLVAMGFDILSK